MRFFISNVKSKSAYWHFITALLLDAHFREVFIYFWKGFRERKGDFECFKQWWDYGKVQIKQLCQQYTLNVSRDVTKSMKDLEVDIVELQSSAQSTGNGGCVENLKSKKSRAGRPAGLQSAGGTSPLAVPERFFNGFPLSKFFFSLEKKNGQSRQIHALRSEDGQRLTDIEGIRSSEYQEVDAVFDAFCENLPTVSEENNRQLEGPLTKEEVFAALQSVLG